MDLMAMAVTRKAEMEEQKRIKEENRKAQVIQNTLSWCEKVGQELEKKAFNGEKPIYTCIFSLENIDEEVNLIKGIKGKYADPKRLSYERYGEKLSLELIKEWFSEFCFTVQTKESKYYQYGWGCLTRYDVVIKPNPNCL